MSFELFAYSDDATPIQTEHFTAKFRRHKQQSRIIRNDKSMVTKDVLRSDDAVVGWRPPFLGGGWILKAVSNVDWKTMNSLHDMNKMGICTVEIWDDPTAYNDPEELRALAKIHGNDYVEIRKQSRVRFYIRLAGGGNNASIAVALTALECILELRGGMLEDPQLDKYRLIKRQV